MSKKKTPSKEPQLEENITPEVGIIDTESLEGALIEEIEITEITEVTFEDSDEDEEFDSLFPTKRKKTQEEIEDEEDFDSYFFED